MGRILRQVALGSRSISERCRPDAVGSTDAARAWLSRGGLRLMERPVPPSGAKAGRFFCFTLLRAAATGRTGPASS